MRGGLDFDTIAEAITPEQLAAAIGAEKHSTGYRCPRGELHRNGDEHGSFSIFRDGDRTAARCHACGLKGSPVTVVSIVCGVSLSEAAERLARDLGLSADRSGGSAKPRIVATYDYTDADGELLFQVVRFEPKGFRQRRPNGQGGWVWNLKGVKERPPYRLPEVIEAVALGKTIYVVEGEKDVEAVDRAGGVATTNPGGAGKWSDEFGEVLRDASVVVVADKDGAGREHARQVAASLDGVAASVKVVEPGHGNDATDHLEAGLGLTDFVQTDAAASASRAAGNTAPGHAGGRRTHGQILLDLASGADLWHARDSVCYASINVDGHTEHHGVKSETFRRWLVWGFYRSEGKPPASKAVQSAVAVLEARALFDGHEHEVFVRVGELGGTIYLDFCDPEWRAVEITEAAWQIVPDPDVRFRRAPGMLPLPLPERGGSIDDLRPFVNAASEEDFRLLVSWLVAALSPAGPYPIEVLQGEHGSAKSTTARVQRALVDPSTAPLRTPPREERDLVIAANNSWVLGFDNVSSIQNWLSDALCRLATGGGWATRQLYTDTTEILFDGQRPQLLNGIEELARRDDLRDRALIINLPSLPDDRRRDERSFWAEFESARPRILGALLSAISGALGDRSSTSLRSTPRMADFALWVTAAERGLGWEAGSFMKAYGENIEAAVQLSAEFNVVGQAIKQMADEKGGWQGTATDLLAALNGSVPEDQRRKSTGWPQTPAAMSNAVSRAAPTLRRLGVDVRRDREAKKRVIYITKVS